MGWVQLLRECVVRKGDNKEDIEAKRLITPVFAVLLVIFGVFSATAVLQVQPIGILVMVLGLFSCIAYFSVSPAVRGGALVHLLEGNFLAFSVCLLLFDLNQAPLLSQRFWPHMVLVLDAALVLKLDRLTPIVIALTIGVLTIERAEAGLRFGLYEAMRWEEEDHGPIVCECASPPCATGVRQGSFMFLLNSLLVLLLDYHMTRGFAKALRLQLHRMGTTCTTVADIAAALARYDVDGAEQVIAEFGEDLPKELEYSFWSL
eukprot:Hpha_TRINITY_DN4463_c0_g1::TRINITY_DN4463_c0_g1_i1::g.50411::m.50411